MEKTLQKIIFNSVLFKFCINYCFNFLEFGIFYSIYRYYSPKTPNLKIPLQFPTKNDLCDNAEAIKAKPSTSILSLVGLSNKRKANYPHLVIVFRRNKMNLLHVTNSNFTP